ncbi:MAG: ATP-binding cassette domain-containing protein [Alphaproteobacteria bacterium]|nr:MAG: ATP-binding cassette domain-containing protein [Alphaproteobacteria bacterium]
MDFIKFKNVCFQHIIKDVSFEIKKGEFVALIGPNGAGKSTILKLLLGILQPTSGAIEKPQHIEIVHQNIEDNVFLDLTVYENFNLFNAFNKEEIKKHLCAFNSNIVLDKVVRFLSGGEKQALALALRLFHKPDLLLLDEHTSALDPETSQKIMSVTYEKTRDVTCLMVTHNLDYAQKYGSAIIEMKAGQAYIRKG